MGVHAVVRGLHGGGLRPRHRRPAQRQYHGQEKWTGIIASNRGRCKPIYFPETQGSGYTDWLCVAVRITRSGYLDGPIPKMDKGWI